MRSYTPRRAGKRWLQNAPHYVLDCFDNRGQSADRYTVIFGKEFMEAGELALLDMSAHPSEPQGIGLSASYPHHQIAAYRYKNGRFRCTWDSLPDEVKACVKNWAETD